MPALVGPVVAAGSVNQSPQPVLTVAELTLRPWVASDAPAVAATYDDPSIRRWHVRSMTEPEAVAWIDDRARWWREETGAEWAVTAGDALLGRMGLPHLNLALGSGKVAYWVLPNARGHGVAARALDRVAQWAFEEVGLHRLEIVHSTSNPASCRVAERAGFALEGTMRAHALHADGWHDMHLHARLAHDPPG